MNYNPFVNPYAMQPAQQTNQINYASQSGFVSVQSEQEARIYPVALGNSITFMDECAPYMYIKTMGRSRFEQPTFEKIRLRRTCWRARGRTSKPPLLWRKSARADIRSIIPIIR